MNKKLTNEKNISKICGNCVHGRHTPDEKQVLCVKHGVMDYYSVCRSYEYDPLNRVPPKPQRQTKFDPEDFVL